VASGTEKEDGQAEEGKRMTVDELDKLEQFARAATTGTWQWALTPTRSRLGAAWWMVRAIFSHRSPSLSGILIGNEDNYRWIAITGNGPDGDANSAYIVAVQPRNVLMLIDEIRGLLRDKERA